MRNLIHGPLGLEFAVTLATSEAMFHVVVLSGHRSQITVCSGTLGKNLILRYLGLELAVALSALEAVFCVIMLGHREQVAVK